MALVGQTAVVCISCHAVARRFEDLSDKGGCHHLGCLFQKKWCVSWQLDSWGSRRVAFGRVGPYMPAYPTLRMVCFCYDSLAVKRERDQKKKKGPEVVPTSNARVKRPVLGSEHDLTTAAAKEEASANQSVSRRRCAYATRGGESQLGDFQRRFHQPQTHKLAGPK